MSEPLVTIILRSFNEAWALEDTLPAIRQQEYAEWEFIVFDSGSTDGSIDLIRAAAPDHFVQLAPHEYNPSRVMNQAMRLARSDFCIFLNADATPQNRNWLRPLATALFDRRTAAVFGRQIPRPDCRAVHACDYERCFGRNRESSRWPHFFSMVSSGVRKDVWAKRGFKETLQYAEDDEYTRWAKAQGYRVVYCAESVVMHSHNYSPAQAYQRSYGDARSLAASWQGARTDFNWPRTVLLGWARDFQYDVRFCLRNGRAKELPHVAVVRWKQRLGKLRGFHDGWQSFRCGKQINQFDRETMARRSSQLAPGSA